MKRTDERHSRKKERTTKDEVERSKNTGSQVKVINRVTWRKKINSPHMRGKSQGRTIKR